MTRLSARRPGAALLVALLLGLACTAPQSAAAAVRPRASVTELYNDLMCTICHESLAVAQSPEAIQERQQVRTLVGQGETTKQIEASMVGQYGPAVLANPPASGFDLLVYVVPPAVVILGIVTLVVAIPRWRRRARRAAAVAAPAVPALSDEDARRLEADLAEQR